MCSRDVPEVIRIDALQKLDVFLDPILPPDAVRPVSDNKTHSFHFYTRLTGPILFSIIIISADFAGSNAGWIPGRGKGGRRRPRPSPNAGRGWRSAKDGMQNKADIRRSPPTSHFSSERPRAWRRFSRMSSASRNA
jgi:hypothetical protein